MFSPAIEKQRRQLYAASLRRMAELLPPVGGDPAELLAALRWGMNEIEATYARSSAKVRADVACRAGCGHCCNVSVDVQAHEVFFVAEFIQVSFSPEALAGVVARAAHRRALAAAAGRGARAMLMHPCALLDDGRCSVYAARPEACRVHHSNDAGVCAAHVADPAVDLKPAYVPELRARLFAVMLGVDEAVEAAGFDARAYDFNSALHEALTNSLCRVLWMRGKPAFPDSCLAD